MAEGSIPWTQNPTSDRILEGVTFVRLLHKSGEDGMNLKARLLRLENKTRGRAPEMPTCIVISSVAPGPDGPVNLGPLLVHILKGPNAGMQLSRSEGESAEAFEARCDAMVEAEQ
jgi:hypothetical protein